MPVSYIFLTKFLEGVKQENSAQAICIAQFISHESLSESEVRGTSTVDVFNFRG